MADSGELCDGELPSRSVPPGQPGLGGSSEDLGIWDFGRRGAGSVWGTPLQLVLG